MPLGTAAVGIGVDAETARGVLAQATAKGSAAKANSMLRRFTCALDR